MRKKNAYNLNLAFMAIRSKGKMRIKSICHGRVKVLLKRCQKGVLFKSQINFQLNKLRHPHLFQIGFSENVIGNRDIKLDILDDKFCSFPFLQDILINRFDWNPSFLKLADFPDFSLF